MLPAEIRSGHPYFMHQEIPGRPRAIRNALAVSVELARRIASALAASGFMERPPRKTQP